MGETDPLRLADLLAIRYVPPRAPGPAADDGGGASRSDAGLRPAPIGEPRPQAGTGSRGAGPVEDLLGVALALDDWAARESAAGETLRANRLRTCGRMVRAALELLADLAVRPPEDLK